MAANEQRNELLPIKRMLGHEQSKQVFYKEFTDRGENELAL